MFRRTHRDVEHVRTDSPVLAALHALLLGLGNELAEGEEGFVRLDRTALDAANRLGLCSLSIGALAGAIQFGLARCAPVDSLIALAQLARELARDGGVGPIDPYLRVLAAEADALLRLARFEDARRTLAEGRELAARAGTPPFVTAVAEIHLALLTNDAAALAGIAESLRGEVAAPIRSVVSGIVLYARAARASLLGDYGEGARLAEEAFDQLDGMSVAGWTSHDVLVEAMLARALSGDVRGARRLIRRGEAFGEHFASRYHAMLARRIEAVLLVAEGSSREALALLDASIATSAASGDVPRTTLGRVIRAVVEEMAGIEGAGDRLATALAEAARVGVFPRILSTVGGAGSRGAALPKAREASDPTLSDRLADAVASLIGRLPNPEAVGPGLLRAAADVAPDRRAILEAVGGEPVVHSPRVDRWFEIRDARGQPLRFGVEGPLGEDLARALETLVASAQRGLSASITRTADPKTTDTDPDVLPELPDFVAASPLLRRLRRSIAQLSPSRATILVTGESGVGKEVVARAVHDLSTRARRAYVAFNCATVPRDLFDSQLFGHRRGAFTGADRDEPGVLRAADKGTVFLDEVGELPLEVQP
jgi:hypothetical protein